MLKPNPKDNRIDHAKLGQAVQQELVENYIEYLASTPRQIWGSFVRGVFTGLGGVLGATLGVTALLFILNQFGGLPVIGEFFRSLGETIKQ
ncbi:MAG TPA: DUF5665 domain-containing protein [Candidatus Saccharimonadales bacterium]|nr:DUF5665 domain-containing protein [Candidatus Saccharimonadales bacterium]